MDRDEIESKIRDLIDLNHRAQMKHTNADRMGDRSLRRQGNDLDKEFETKLKKLLDTLAPGYA